MERVSLSARKRDVIFEKKKNFFNKFPIIHFVLINSNLLRRIKIPNTLLSYISSNHFRLAITLSERFFR